MRLTKNRRRGFSLVELLISVAIVAVIASVAMPGFGTFVMKSKASEAYSGLGIMSRGAAAYYERDFAEEGLGSSSYTHCTVFELHPDYPANMIPNPPITPDKKDVNFAEHPAYAALGFTPTGGTYFHYSIDNATNNYGANVELDEFCNKDDEELYVFYAISDLDGDGEWGTLSTSAWSEGGKYVRSPGFSHIYFSKSLTDQGGSKETLCPNCVDRID